MTCRAAIRPDPIRGAHGVIFGFPTDPPPHDPDWQRLDDVTGLPICRGCDLPLYAALWAAGACPGRPVKGGTA